MCNFSLGAYFQVVLVYNPLGWNRVEVIRIPVSTLSSIELCSVHYFSPCKETNVLNIYGNIISASDQLFYDTNAIIPDLSILSSIQLKTSMHGNRLVSLGLVMVNFYSISGQIDGIFIWIESLRGWAMFALLLSGATS